MASSAEMMVVVFQGTCYRCGAKGFKETCREFPLPPDWFYDALERVKARGWVFAGGDGTGHSARAYCKHCWEATEG